MATAALSSIVKFDKKQNRSAFNNFLFSCRRSMILETALGPGMVFFMPTRDGFSNTWGWIDSTFLTSFILFFNYRWKRIPKTHTAWVLATINKLLGGSSTIETMMDGLDIFVTFFLSGVNPSMLPTMAAETAILPIKFGTDSFQDGWISYEMDLQNAFMTSERNNHDDIDRTYIKLWRAIRNKNRECRSVRAKYRNLDDKWVSSNTGAEGMEKALLDEMNALESDIENLGLETDDEEDEGESMNLDGTETERVQPSNSVGTQDEESSDEEEESSDEASDDEPAAKRRAVSGKSNPLLHFRLMSNV
jgi:hypothetical protein